MLYHITTLAAWGQSDPYVTDSLANEGFIHFSTAAQVAWVANDRFRGRDHLWLLVIDPARLTAPVVFEDCYQTGQEFPHLYGPLERAAVVALLPLAPGPDGSFVLPAEVGRFEAPLLEPLDEGPAFIEPGRRFTEQVLPERCVLVFFQEVLAELENPLTRLGSEIGPNPVFVIEHGGQPIAVAHPGVGGPLAAASLEELIALGCSKFVAVGGAGSLKPEQQVGHLVVVTEAVRDEGVSYQYLPPARTVAASSAAITALESTLRQAGAPFCSGCTWTTDALYRETPPRLERRRQQGCLTVEMESASFLAVAQYRGVPFAQLLYCGDDLSGQEWDFRDWDQHTSLRQKLFWLAVEACLAL
ncbi:MAG: DUF952 domain-containing protein [Vulcanimicrobiota bacterium]